MVFNKEYHFLEIFLKNINDHGYDFQSKELP